MADATHWVYDDGGRSAAGFTGTTGDCTVRAIAIAAQLPYREVYNGLAVIAKTEHLKRKRKSPRDGVARSTYERYLRSLGWTWTPTMTIGSGTTIHLRADELPPGRLVVRVSKHHCAVVDGVIRDAFDPSREGTRCVYGYWHFTPKPRHRQAQERDQSRPTRPQQATADTDTPAPTVTGHTTIRGSRRGG